MTDLPKISPKLGNPGCWGAMKAHFDMPRNPRINQDRSGWPLWRLLFLLACMVGDPSSAMSRDKPVAYVLKVKGQDAGAHKMGSAIRNGETINVGPATQVEAFHKSQKRCRTIRISGKISVTFRRTSYSPRSSPQIQILKEGCAPIRTPKDSDAGITLRGKVARYDSWKKILVDTVPSFLIEGDVSQYRNITLVDQANPKNITAITVPSGASLVTWPSGLKPLKPNSAYEIVLTGVGVTLPLQGPFKTTPITGDRKASNLVIIDLGDGT
jgi:hypothetical protein